MSSNKFYSLDKLKKRIKSDRKKGKKIAVANGCFDLIHVGHVRYLRGAKKVSDVLVVALNSDRSLKRLKGDNRPIIDEEGRIKIISSFEFVDYVTVFQEDTVDNVITIIKPDFLCKGSDYTEESVPEIDTVRSCEGKVVIVGGDKIRSTSDIIERINHL